MSVEQGSRNPEPSTAVVGVTKAADGARERELARLAAQVEATGAGYWVSIKGRCS